MNMSPAAAPMKYMTKSSQNCTVRSMTRQFEFHGLEAPGGLGTLLWRLDQMAFRRVADEQRQSPDDHPDDDAQGDHGRRALPSPPSPRWWWSERIEQPRREWGQDHRRKAEARDDDAGDEAGALGAGTT